MLGGPGLCYLGWGKREACGRAGVVVMLRLLRPEWELGGWVSPPLSWCHPPVPVLCTLGSPGVGSPRGALGRRWGSGHKVGQGGGRCWCGYWEHWVELGQGTGSPVGGCWEALGNAGHWEVLGSWCRSLGGSRCCWCTYWAVLGDGGAGYWAALGGASTGHWAVLLQSTGNMGQSRRGYWERWAVPARLLGALGSTAAGHCVALSRSSRSLQLRPHLCGWACPPAASSYWPPRQPMGCGGARFERAGRSAHARSGMSGAGRREP